MMKKRGIVIICLMSLLLIFSTSTTTFAEENNTIEEYKIFNSIDEAEAELDSVSPIYLYYGDNNSNTRLLVPDATMYPFFVRSGNTTKVEMYLSYEGKKPASILSIEHVKIWNDCLWFDPDRELLDEEYDIYTRLAAGKLRKFPAGIYYVPTADKKVRVDWDNARVYVLDVGWVEATDPVGAYDAA